MFTRRSITACVLLVVFVTVLHALAPPNNSRRSFFNSIATTVVASTLATTAPALAADSVEDVYFGVGCFWHIQHEFVEAERTLLGRTNDMDLTSLAGYAGGKSVGDQGRVCYHNFQRLADYGKLGHGEVVGMKLPTDKIGDFAQVYFSLYNPRTKDRVDPLDIGPEYRSLIGLPGGTSHPAYDAVEQAAANAGFKLKKGQGNDPDTLGKQTVYVYDTAQFPFYPAEVYHQFHNDFQSPAYGRKYNNIANEKLAAGMIGPTGCPDRV